MVIGLRWKLWIEALGDLWWRFAVAMMLDWSPPLPHACDYGEVSHSGSGCRNCSMRRIVSSTWRIACFTWRLFIGTQYSVVYRPSKLHLAVKVLLVKELVPSGNDANLVCKGPSCVPWETNCKVKQETRPWDSGMHPHLWGEVLSE